MSLLMRNTAVKIFYPLALLIAIAVAVCMASGKLALAAILALVPVALVLICASFTRKVIAFMFLFTLNYFIPLMGRYMADNTSIGLFLDLAITFNFLVICCSCFWKKPNVKNISTDLILAIVVWLIYCLAEVYNPRLIEYKAWLSSVRSMALYFIFVVLLVQLSVDDMKDVKVILAVWSVLIIVATIKVVYQRYVGWTRGDMHFLYDLDGHITHIIFYGIRYFSIFSDAANYGGSMGMSVVVFLVYGFHTKNILGKIYWWIIAGMACYGMFLSGTRSALVVPVAGILVYLVLVRNIKTMIPSALGLAFVISILAFTTIGESYTAIRRARTIFHHSEDASYIARKDNQRTLRELMKDMPFGNSLGMSAGRAHEYGDYSPVTEIPTDSWFVQLWVEAGVIGVFIYFIVMGYILIKACIVIFFRIRDPEVKGITAGFISGVIGLFVMSSNNEVFSQFPNGVIVYSLIALVNMAPIFDRQALESKNGIADNSKLQRA